MIIHKYKYTIITIVVLALAAALFLYPTNYFIKKPGKAYGADDYIEVEKKDEDDEGEFRFTTVAIMPATPFLVSVALFSPDQDIVEREEVYQDEEDPEEYRVRQLQLMDNSKFNAISVAFEKAGLSVQQRFKGLSVLNVLENSAAAGKLQTGDVIVEAEGVTLKNTEQFTEMLDGKKNGDTFRVVVDRNDELVEEVITLKEIPKSDGKIGLGISYAESKSIMSEPRVKMETEEIGGPSAGLMFTLEILNQLLDEDISKGYVIAGTGTMNADGSVGRIGGIDKKVIAASKAGAKYFLAPNDDIPKEVLEKNPTLQTNYEEAEEAIKKIKTDMEIIPVKSIDDALSFLNALKPKGE